MLVLLILCGCDAQQMSLTDQLAMDGSSVSVPLPELLRTAKDIDPEAVRAIVTINGVETALQRNAEGRFSGQITVLAQSDVTLQIDFMEVYLGQLLTLARAEKSVSTGTDNASVSLLREDYDYASFDSDGDGASNIVERQFNTNPLDAAETPQLINIEVFAELPATLVAADFNSYQLVATIADQTRVIDASVGQFRETFTVVAQENLAVTIRLVEGVTGQGLTIGEQIRLIPDSQTDTQDNVLVIFGGTTWNFNFDQDADGVSNAEELVAGTDLFTGSLIERIPFTVAFDIPTEIVNTETVFATLAVNGQNVPLSRTDNTYTGLSSSQAGASVEFEARIRDTHTGISLVLASFTGQAVPQADSILQLQGFSTDHDVDNDGIVNYLELAQGTDPFNAELQCTLVTETIFATLTDDAFLQKSRLQNNARLQVDSDQRISLLRFQYDQSVVQVIDATLYMTVGSDAGDGLLTVAAVSDFQWNEESRNILEVPSGELAVSVDNNWESGVSYPFSLTPEFITSDVTLVVQQSNGNDVAFLSSNTAVSPALELTVERCQTQ